MPEIRMLRCAACCRDFPHAVRPGPYPRHCDRADCLAERKAKALAEREARDQDRRARADAARELRRIDRERKKAPPNASEELLRILRPITEQPETLRYLPIVVEMTLEVSRAGQGDRAAVTGAVRALAQSKGIAETRAAARRLAAQSMAWLAVLPEGIGEPAPITEVEAA